MQVWAFPRSLATTKGMISLPPGTKMFQFPGFPPPGLWVQPGVPWVCHGGFPHSEIPGSKAAHASPRLIAVCRVLHRLLAPRHPPQALSSLPVMRRTRSSSLDALYATTKRFLLFYLRPIHLLRYRHCRRCPPVAEVYHAGKPHRPKVNVCPFFKVLRPDKPARLIAGPHPARRTFHLPELLRFLRQSKPPWVASGR